MLIHTRFLPFSSAGELSVVLFAAGLGVPGILRRLKGVSAPTGRDCVGIADRKPSGSDRAHVVDLRPGPSPPWSRPIAGGMVVDVRKGKHL